MGEINGVFIYQGRPTNGATAKLWQKAGFTDPPEYDDAEPDAGFQEGATITTGVTYGGDGAYRWTSVPDGEYYVSCYYATHRVWIYAHTEIIADILTTNEDLLVRRGGVLTRIPKDDDGKALTMVAGQVAWATLLEMETSVSEVLQHSNDDQRSTNNTEYTKKKEIKIQNYFKGGLRIKFRLGVVPVATGYGRIYHNGVAIGTERTTEGETTFSEDFDIILFVNDLLQIYIYTSDAGKEANAANFRLYYDVGSWLNQDPA